MLAPTPAHSQDFGPTDPAYGPLTRAFDSLRARDYDRAISAFTEAARLSPTRADIRKNLGYTLLKTGDSEAAREAFGEAFRLEPSDEHLALEYAFLCFEARDNAPARKAEARRIFALLRVTGDAASRATAEQAFRNIDAPLETGIARWRQVLATSSPTFSAFYELAQLAEQRDELELAASSYTAAFRLLPERKSVLLELARVEKARGNSEGAMAALMAASRGGEPRASELARVSLPDRYPYVYEFRKALELDPTNDGLHRELAYLLLRMSESDETLRKDAENEFAIISATSPQDYIAAAQLGLLYLADNQTDLALPILKNVIAHADPATANRARMALKMPLVLEERQAGDAIDPRVLGQRSYDAGFLKDAKRYFLAAYEMNPVDAEVALKLGWTNNMLHDDLSAVQWFNIARRSSDSAIAKEAGKAWKSLRTDTERFRSTFWVYPILSSRWNDLFAYGQFKTEIKLKTLPFRPYLSLRFVGDARRNTGGVSPQSLSESAVIAGLGAATRSWHGAMAWGEVGAMVSYLNGSRSKDTRAGISWSKTIGSSIASEHNGLFLESLADSVFVGRFDNDLINNSQNRVGYTALFSHFRTQTFWAYNLTFDAKHQYWANFAETGPGFRFHPKWLPDSVTVTFSAMRGIYMINNGNPRRPNFNDFRTGVWYAFTK